MSFSEEEAVDFSAASEKATDTASCPTCGGKMVYSPADRALKCEYCGGLVSIDLSKRGAELKFCELLDAEKNAWSNETHVMRCNNCGAKTVISRSEISKECPFCGTTNVVQTEELSGVQPNAVLPFLLSREEACNSVKAWAKKKLFAPSKFKKNVSPQEVAGNYTPAFTFDSDTFTSYSGRLGVHKTKTEIVDGKEVSERYTEWFNIKGTFSLRFDDVLVHASEEISQKNINRISPFDTNGSNKYSSEFLHGYSAMQYTRNGTSCWGDAKCLMRGRIKSAILRKYDYDEIETFNFDVDFQNITYKYVLLPVYVGRCLYSQKCYNFFVNGQSGRVTGKVPVSPWRVLFAVFLGIAAVAALGLAIFLLAKGAMT